MTPTAPDLAIGSPVCVKINGQLIPATYAGWNAKYSMPNAKLGDGRVLPRKIFPATETVAPPTEKKPDSTVRWPGLSSRTHRLFLDDAGICHVHGPRQNSEERESVLYDWRSKTRHEPYPDSVTDKLLTPAQRRKTEDANQVAHD